ncbi:proteoglycan 4-like isoform X1 [Dendronephthya gigantea]|uniref:proteoglycan 4-like isoform X1 n=1 Tax=Dendronephthya gigantea TaxID=151771 RepID=UPI00106CA77B|nr:proteoglycan 4-like isoform X1 [Dendronephthya gigantea]
MKNIVFLLVAFLGILCNFSGTEACGGWSRKIRGRNPKIVVTTKKPTEMTTEAMTKLTEATRPSEPEVTTPKAPTEREIPTEPEVTTPKAPTEREIPTEPEVTTPKAPTEREISTEPKVTTPKAPTEREISTEPEVTTRKATTKAVMATEPKAVEPDANIIEPLTRPTSVHKFFKQSAFVKSTKDERTCSDVKGECKVDCDVQTEYVQGSFQCPVRAPLCCGKR